MKNKEMSHNKKIELLRSITGRSYKECRTALKSNGWNIERLLPLLNADTFTEYLNGLKNGLSLIAEKAYNAVEGVLNVVRETVKEVNDE